MLQNTHLAKNEKQLKINSGRSSQAFHGQRSELALALSLLVLQLLLLELLLLNLGDRKFLM